MAPATWTASAPLTIQAVLRLSNASLQAIIATGVKVDGFVLLVTAERTFDADGIMRLPGRRNETVRLWGSEPPSTS